MYSKMEKLQCFNAFVVFFTLSIKLTNVVSCPSNCVCGGQTKDSVACQAGLTALPSGLSGTVTSLSLSGLPSNHNVLHHIQQSDFQSLTNLYTLSVTYSEVKTIDDGAFAGLNDLHDLILANNELGALKGEHFRGLPKLRTLDVSGNRRCQFDKTLFTHMKDIEELNLGDMEMYKLPSDIFSELTKLKVLKLYSNKLVKIEPAILTPLGMLETLDLNGNMLRDLPKALKPKLNSLKSLHLSQNPWECHCQLYWFRELKHEFLINGAEGGEVICNGPPKVQYHSFLNVHDSDFICIPPKVLRCDQTQYRIDVHHTLTMHCEFEGDPIPEVKWIQPGGTAFAEAGTTHGQYTIWDNGTLVISGVDKIDDGQWTFQVYNGTASDSTPVVVEVTGITTTTLSTSSTSTTTTTTKTTPTTRTTPTTLSSSTPTSQTTVTSKAKTTSATLMSIGRTVTKATFSSAGSLKNAPVSQTSAPPFLSGTNVFISSKSPPELSLLKSTQALPSGPNVTSSSPTPRAIQSTSKTSDDKKADNAINIGLIVAAAAGGGTLVGVIFIIVLCCKRKSNAEKSKVRPFDYDI